jgi:hypothetical protein
MRTAGFDPAPAWEERSRVLSQIGIHNLVLLGWGLLAFWWALSVVWIAFDVRGRCSSLPAQAAWALVGLALPGLGLLAYVSLRPRTTLEQRYAHALWLELAEQARNVERCPTCRTEIEASFVACPVCATRLRDRCGRCDAALEPAWLVCPYCETPVAGPALEPTRRGARDEQVPAPQAAPVAAPSRAHTKQRSTKPRVEPVPKRAA